MDRKLVAWARMVKTRSRHAPGPPPLWLFTDRRLADPIAAVRAMSVARHAGLFGVVLRGADRQTVGLRLARLCRSGRVPLLVAGDARRAAALRAGLHLPSGRRTVVHVARGRLLSASAHDVGELRRAIRAGASMVFLSPVFATDSHPGARPLGPLRASRLALTSRSGARLFALGGVDGRRARGLTRRFGGAGAVSSLR